MFQCTYKKGDEQVSQNSLPAVGYLKIPEDGDPYLESDTVFAVKESLIRKLEDTTDPKDGSNAKTLEFNIVMQK